MATMRELKGRINSVHSSQKITGAMKMISSARLRKAENKLLQAEPYRRKLWEIYAHIEKSAQSIVGSKNNNSHLLYLALHCQWRLKLTTGFFNMGIYFP